MGKATYRPTRSRKRRLALDALRRRLGGAKRLQEFLGRESKRRTELGNDAVFVGETEYLQEAFEAAYLSKPKRIDSFLGQFRLPSPFKQSQIGQFLGGIPPRMSALLSRYVQYASRFGVYFVRRSNSFDWRVMPEFGWKFQVHQKEGHLEAVGHVPEDSPASDYFESPTLKVAAPFQALIDRRVAKFVQIDDVSGTSAFNELENFSYYDGGLTFIVHNAEHPYLYCLVGEKTTKQLWAEAAKSVSAFQRQFGRGKGGRPADLLLRKRMRKALKRPGRKKDKAVQLTPTIATASGQSYLSRVGKHERERPARIAKMKRQFDSEG